MAIVITDDEVQEYWFKLHDLIVSGKSKEELLDMGYPRKVVHLAFLEIQNNYPNCIS